MPAARHASLRARASGRSWPQRLVIALGCLVIIVSTAAAAMAGYVGVRFGQISRVGDITLQGRAAGGPANFLLVGNDSREGIDKDDPDSGGFLGSDACNCTDTIILLRVDPDQHTAALLSFPRDLFLPISGTGQRGRINTAHAHGVQTLIDTIQDNFEIPVNHYVEIDFVGFQRLVDSVGGVPMWFDAPVRDPSTGLDVPGAECQVLDGEQARKFVRARHLQYRTDDGRWVTDQSADLGRITRQQVFIRRAVAKAVAQGLTNPVKLNELVSVGVANVRIDKLLTAGDILSLGRDFAEFDSDELDGYSIPVEPFTTAGGAQVVRPLMRQAQAALNVFRGLPPGTVTPDGIDVTVLNGAGVDGQAADAAAALDSIGFNIDEVSTFDTSDIGRTTVQYGAGGAAAARRVAAHITGGAALVQIDGLETYETVVVTGADFTTIHGQPAPEGSPDQLRTTTSAVSGQPSDPGATTTTAPPTTTTTAPIGYAAGEPPPGVTCG